MSYLSHLNKIREHEVRSISEILKINLPIGSKILELGAGTGWQSQYLSDLGYVVNAIDLSTSNYRDARVWPITDYDGVHIPFADDTFDCVFSSNVLEHIPNVEYFQYEIQRVLRKDGLALHVVPTTYWRFWTSILHYFAVLKRLFSILVKKKSLSVATNSCVTPKKKWKEALYPKRHGEFGNVITELYYFSRYRWLQLFKKTRWQVCVDKNEDLFYTGHGILGERLSIRNRKILKCIFGNSCQTFLLRKKLDDKLSILVVTTSFPVVEQLNSGVFVKKLVDALCQYCNPVVIAPSFLGRSPGPSLYPIICVRYAPGRLENIAHIPGGIPQAIKKNNNSLILIPSMIVSLLIYLFKYMRNCDVVLANWSVCGFLSGLVGAFLFRPVVTIFRGSDVSNINNNKIKRIITLFCLILSKKVVCVSNNIAEDLKNCFPTKKSKINFIENGVDEKFIEIGVNRIFRDVVSSDPVNLVVVSSLIPGKRIDSIISALGIIGPNYFLHVVGSGVEINPLRDLSKKLNIENNIFFYGTLTSIEVSEKLKNADMFLFSSESEGRSNALYEAMAAGLPIIASNIPGNIELIVDDQTGLLFEVGNHEDLAKKIIKLKNNPKDAIRLGRNAHQFIVQSGFTWSNTARKYHELLTSLKR
jgi:glycosyltransferase involved in cell wall biosynthesis